MYRIFLIFFCLVGHLEANCLANTPFQGSTSSSVGTTEAQVIKCTTECLVSPVQTPADPRVTGYIEKDYVFSSSCSIGCRRVPGCGIITFQVKVSSEEIKTIGVPRDEPATTQNFICDDSGYWSAGGGKIQNITQFICSYEPTGC